jgi:RNA polymerase sigma-70 factor (ECF subfamily)
MSVEESPAQGPRETQETEARLVAALRRGDESTFRALVTEHHQALRRLARLYVPQSIVEDVVQETWAAVVRGLPAFEGRASLKTWIYRILLNQARKHGQRERRTIPFAAASSDGAWPGAVDPARLVNPQLGPNYWPAPPPSWRGDPEDRLVAAEMRQVVADGLVRLSDAQREVVTLRDVEGWSSEEVCDVLGISSVNQRALLHRGRTALRRALEEYFDGA